jgi:hypothetical protein
MTEDDTEMADNPGYEAETAPKSPDGLRKDGAEGILETIELDQEPDWSQRQVRDAMPEEDVSAPMDEDTMSEFPKEATEKYHKTPERGASEYTIPDSFDGAEEETIRDSSPRISQEAVAGRWASFGYRIRGVCMFQHTPPC